MSERRLIGFIIAQRGAPGPASAVRYDIKVNEGNASVTYTNVVPSTWRPPEESDIGAVAPNTAIEVWDIDGVLHFMFTEREHVEDCSAGPPPPPLMHQIIAAIGRASPAERAALRAAMGVQPV